MNITKETAILAKVAGFREFNGKYYQDDSKVTEAILARPNSYDNSTFRYIKCIQPELQKWLRDIHNIDVQAYLIEMVSNGRQLKQTLEEKEYTYRIYQDGIDIFIGKTHHNLSYEQALEIGLQEALKLIGNKVCKHEWIMTADSFDQTCYCKKCGETS